MASEILHDVSTPALVRAIEDNVAELFRQFRRWPRMALGDGPELLWTLSDVPFPLFNSVLAARLPDEAAEAQVAAAVARGRARQVPMLWWTGPATRPATLGDTLQAHGFARLPDLPGMAADLTALGDTGSTPPGLRIERAGDAAALADWGAALVAGFAMPAFVGEAFAECNAHLGCEPDAAFRHYVGRINGETVATSSLFLGAGVAGLYNVAVLPSARRTGIGAAMTLRPLHDARAAGYRVAILHASEMGAGVYRALGFEEHCRIGRYVWMGDAGG